LRRCIVAANEDLCLDRKSHWDQVYRDKPADAVSWFQPRADRSIDWIRSSGTPASMSIIDVGSGATRLIDALIAEGYGRITALDLSGAALAATRARIGAAADAVEWIEADITRVSLPRHAYDVWHDRAVFHFLTEADQRRAYLDSVAAALKPGGHAIIATFAEDGPTRCSGLPVMRYSPESLQATFGPGFELVRSMREIHTTPSGAEQRFIYCELRKREA
jgi:SAM-dependent methyltransferase